MFILFDFPFLISFFVFIYSIPTLLIYYPFIIIFISVYYVVPYSVLFVFAFAFLSSLYLSQRSLHAHILPSLPPGHAAWSPLLILQRLHVWSFYITSICVTAFIPHCIGSQRLVCEKWCLICKVKCFVDVWLINSNTTHIYYFFVLFVIYIFFSRLSFFLFVCVYVYLRCVHIKSHNDNNYTI